MLRLDSLKQFYFLPELHDMRCGANRIMETVRIKYGRNPYKGDVFIYMSKNRRRVRLVHYKNNAFYFHEKTYKKTYKFMKLSVALSRKDSHFNCSHYEARMRAIIRSFMETYKVQGVGIINYLTVYFDKMCSG